jgi:hypothetical protein
MRISRKAALVLLATASLAVGGALSITAAGGAESEVVNRSLLEASSKTGPMLNGAMPAPHNWSIVRGAVQMRASGRLDVLIDRLVQTATKRAGLVHFVTASLYCNGETMAAATTAAVPLTPAGKAVISEMVALPSPCLAPTVLVHPLGIPNLYIAASDA